MQTPVPTPDNAQTPESPSNGQGGRFALLPPTTGAPEEQRFDPVQWWSDIHADWSRLKDEPSGILTLLSTHQDFIDPDRRDELHAALTFAVRTRDRNNRISDQEILDDRLPDSLPIVNRKHLYQTLAENNVRAGEMLSVVLECRNIARVQQPRRITGTFLMPRMSSLATPAQPPVAPAAPRELDEDKVTRLIENAVQKFLPVTQAPVARTLEQPPEARTTALAPLADPGEGQLALLPPSVRQRLERMDQFMSRQEEQQERQDKNQQLALVVKDLLAQMGIQPSNLPVNKPKQELSLRAQLTELMETMGVLKQLGGLSEAEQAVTGKMPWWARLMDKAAPIADKLVDKLGARIENEDGAVLEMLDRVEQTAEDHKVDLFLFVQRHLDQVFDTYERLVREHGDEGYTNLMKASRALSGWAHDESLTVEELRRFIVTTRAAALKLGGVKQAAPLLAIVATEGVEGLRRRFAPAPVAAEPEPTPRRNRFARQRTEQPPEQDWLTGEELPAPAKPAAPEPRKSSPPREERPTVTHAAREAEPRPTPASSAGSGVSARPLDLTLPELAEPPAREENQVLATPPADASGKTDHVQTGGMSGEEPPVARPSLPSISEPNSVTPRNEASIEVEKQEVAKSAAPLDSGVTPTLGNAGQQPAQPPQPVPPTQPGGQP